jgi:GDP-L-fucose synthase
MDANAKIYVAGHRGLVGAALVRALRAQGFHNIVTRTHAELELRDQPAVEAFFRETKPDYVFLAAAKVGGIHANSTYPADFIADNLAIQGNIIQSAYRNEAKKLLFLGSSCIYPKLAPQPLKEEYLLTGPLEPTNEWYAIAKIAGIKMVQAFRQQYGFNGISVMPTNLYGPEDNFHPQNSHVLPALIRRFHEAKLADAPAVTIWGSGTPLREFLHVDDLADACLFLMKTYESSEIVNIGTGTDLSIRELAEAIKEVTAYKGEIEFDPTKPDGTPRKLMDVGRLTSLGWTAKVPLNEGLKSTYNWFTSSVQGGVH